MEYMAFKEVEDFVFNLSFQKWILYNDPESAQFWEGWIEQHPGHLKIINDAKAIIFALKLNCKGLSDIQINQEIQKIMRKLEGEEEPTAAFHNPLTVPLRAQRWKKYRTVVAIGIIAVTMAVIWQLQNARTPSVTISTRMHGYPGLADDALISYSNQSDSTELVVLPDKSQVFIKGHSTIQYARKFEGANREVMMTGEAFFDVKRDATHPFLVITNMITTKVLGTSFTVRAQQGMDPVVIVKSGKVSVFKTNEPLLPAANNAGSQAIVLTPNQALTYSAGSKAFVKTLVDKPVMVTDSLKVKFVFEGTPLKEVLRSLQEAYGIPVIYDEEIIASCSISATLGNENFFEKLDMICRAINADYEKIDGNIVITSKGCK